MFPELLHESAGAEGDPPGDKQLIGSANSTLLNISHCSVHLAVLIQVSLAGQILQGRK